MEKQAFLRKQEYFREFSLSTSKARMGQGLGNMQICQKAYSFVLSQ